MIRKTLLFSQLTVFIILGFIGINAHGQNAKFIDHGFIPAPNLSADLGFQRLIYKDGYVFVATTDGVWKNNLRTKEWTAAGLQGVKISCWFKHPTVANKFFAGGYMNADPNFRTPNRVPLFISNDGGTTWSPAQSPVNENYFCFAVRPDQPDHIYANVQSLENSGFCRSRQYLGV